MITKASLNSNMKVKRLKKDDRNSELSQVVSLPPRPLSAITSIGSPEPDISEINNDSTVINKHSTSPETNSTIVSSQLPSTFQSNEIQPIIHHNVYKPTCSKINANQSFKRCGFTQNQICPERSIETLNSFDRTPTAEPSRNSNNLPTPEEPILRRIQRPACQTTYRTIQVKEKSPSRFPTRRRFCCFCSPCCCLILSIVLALALAGLAALIAVFSLPHTTTTISISNFFTSTSSTSTMSTTESTTTLSTSSVTTVASNLCTATWSNITNISICTNCPDIEPYRQYSYTYVAISNFTRLTFAFREDVGYFALDTISVRSISTPSINLVDNSGFETGNLSSWIYCNPSASSYAGITKKNSDNFVYKGKTYQAYLGNYFYLDGAVGNADYLSQMLSTDIGDTYNISFWLYNQGNGINRFANVIFSI